MDNYYNSIGAGEHLKTFSATMSNAADSRGLGKERIRKRGSNRPTPGQPSKSKHMFNTIAINSAVTLTQDTQWRTKYKIERFEGPTTLRLVQTDEHDQVAEEAVFSIQGVLSAKNLPPITEKIR
jgi:hypothetical protein